MRLPTYSVYSIASTFLFSNIQLNIFISNYGIMSKKIQITLDVENSKENYVTLLIYE